MTMTLLTRTLAAVAALPAGLALAAAAPACAQPESSPQAMVAKGHFVMQDGETIFRNVCQACHMADGKGAVGAGKYPSLARNPKLASPVYPARVIIHGQKGMPALGEFLDDAQVAAVVTYVRTHFDNAYTAPVTAEQVKAQR
jgi:mono/diheme cytochrome c family protein